MSKSIKVTEEVYQELRALQRTRETYNDVIARLIAVDKGLMGLYTVVGGVQSFGEWQREQNDIIEKARLQTADLESRRLDTPKISP